jgi:tetratricopeptide (TPR) repeat protein
MHAAISQEKRFEQVLADFLQAEERGERPDRSALLETNPELETQLREFFRDRDRFARLAPTVRDPRGQSQPEPSPVSHCGGYAVREKLGQGGRGIVYRVSDPELKRSLAVKVLRPELRGEPDAVRRFLEEAQVMGQLQHPGIVPVHAVGQLPDGRPYFAMKLVQGRTLAQLLEQRPAPAHDLPRFLVIFQQVCQAVAYAHDRGVIHRDLKPGNVMVGAFAEVQVMDWGLAKVRPAGGEGHGHAQGEPETLVLAAADTVRTLRTEASGLSSVDGLVLGTFAYMAPEQAQGRVEELDPRADVFGLGAILCEVLTGLPPYAGASAWELRWKAAAGDLADALARLDGCGADAGLIALARDCLAPQRECRPRDAAAVAERLASYLAEVQERLRQAELDTAAAQARAEEARAKVRAERRVRRLSVGLAAAVLAVAVALGVGGLWLQRQQAENARQAETLRRDVSAALAQALQFRRGALFNESRALLEQAQRWLGTAGPADQRQRVDQALADTRLAQRLDAARQKAFTVVEGPRLGSAGTEQEYAAALREAGLVRQAGEEAAVVAARVRDSGVGAEIVAALDDWASLTTNGPHQAWLLTVARLADPDPQRDRLRQPELWQNGPALTRVARETRVAKLSPQLATTLGRVLLQNGGDAVPLLRAAHQHHPQDFWLNCYMGFALGEAKQWNEAMGYYRAALAVRPGSAAVQHNLGDALRGRGKLDEAIIHLRAAIGIEPKYAVAHYNLGRALDAKGQRDDAVRHYRKALDIDPEDALAHNELGIALRDKGRVDEAISHYRKALGIYRKALDMQRNPRDIQRKYLHLKPSYAGAHNNLGVALIDKGRVDEAIQCWERALRLDPRSIDAHNNLGGALYDRGQWDEAVRHYRKALDIDPGNAAALYNIGDALRDRDRLDEAIDHYRKALKSEPRTTRIRNNLGIALCRKGRVEEGIREYQQVLKINPKDTKAHYNIGLARCMQGRLDEAIGYYKEAIRRQPNNAGAHYNLGLALYKTGRVEEAIGPYREAVRHDPRNAQAHGALGQAFLLLGRIDEARTATRRCLELLPKDHPQRPAVMQQLRRCEEAPRN